MIALTQKFHVKVSKLCRQLQRTHTYTHTHRETHTHEHIVPKVVGNNKFVVVLEIVKSARGRSRGRQRKSKRMRQDERRQRGYRQGGGSARGRGSSRVRLAAAGGSLPCKFGAWRQRFPLLIIYGFRSAITKRGEARRQQHSMQQQQQEQQLKVTRNRNSNTKQQVKHFCSKAKADAVAE